jgi:PP-loop superfamily ATP-utilizing enzyme
MGSAKPSAIFPLLRLKQTKKKRLCEEALEYREESVRIVEQATPFDHWNIGVFRNYEALVYTELAAVEVNRSKKQELFEKASGIED